MARVYSTRFIAGTSTEGEVLEYTVPAGFTAIIRSLTAVCADPGGGVTPVWAIVLDGSELCFFAFQDISTGSSSDQWEGRVVINAGEGLQVDNPQVPTVYLTASGYLLSLP